MFCTYSEDTVNMSESALKQNCSYTEDDYYALPDEVRAELINGVFYDMAPPSRQHQGILSILHARIFNYIESHNGSCRVYPAPFAVRLFDDSDTIVEPDISVICDPSKLTDRGCSGAPDWIIEITSPSNMTHDYFTKLNLYSKAGVREYWIVNPIKKTIIVYFFNNNDPDVFTYKFQDTVKVNIYDNLYINFAEIEKLLG